MEQFTLPIYGSLIDAVCGVIAQTEKVDVWPARISAHSKKGRESSYTLNYILMVTEKKDLKKAKALRLCYT